MNKQRLEELLLAWEEDRLTTEESVELKQLLTAHPEARQRLVETGVLESVAGARVRAWERFGTGAVARPGNVIESPRLAWFRWMPFAAAACAAIFAVVMWEMSRSASREVAHGARYVAELAGTEAAVWVEGTPPLQAGENLKPSTLELVSGRIELHFMEGASVAIQGPAKIELVSEKRMRLFSGRLSADVPTRAIGFTVDTPVSEVRDLGTRFGVAVTDGGATETHVFEGKVDVMPNAAPGRTGRVTRLLADQGLALTTGQKAPVPIVANPTAFPLPERIVPVSLPCAGFEVNAPGWNAGDAYPPNKFGVWEGDYIIRVGAERGIVPKGGTGMLRFMGAMRPGYPPAKAGRASELYCWIDLRPYQAKWKGRRITAEFSTWFNRISSPESNLTAPTVIAATFGAGIQPGQAAWEARLDRNNPGHALSNCDAEIRSDDDPATWEQATARVTIAPEAELLLLSVRVRSDVGNPADRRFDDVYADEPTLTFRLGNAIPNPR
jgi:hypothetical protein